jgi:hypothetical protein
VSRAWGWTGVGGVCGAGVAEDEGADGDVASVGIEGAGRALDTAALGVEGALEGVGWQAHVKFWSSLQRIGGSSPAWNEIVLSQIWYITCAGGVTSSVDSSVGPAAAAVVSSPAVACEVRLRHLELSCENLG